MSYPIPHHPRIHSERVVYRARRQPRWYSNRWLLFVGAAGLISIILFPFFLIGGTAAYYTLSGRIYPGVSIARVPAGNLTRAELAQRIDASWNHQAQLVLTDGIRSWPAAPLDLGLWVDPQATADLAYAIGRDPYSLQEILWLARFRDIPIQPVVVFNPDAARMGLERMAQHINTPAQNAELRFENGEWVAVPGQNGSAIDLAATLAKVSSDPQAIMHSGFSPLVLQTVVPRIADLSPALEQLRSALATPLRLRAYDPITDETFEWSVPPEILANWVRLENQEENISIHLDEQPLVAYLNEWQAGLGDERALEPFSPPSDLSALWQAGEPLELTILHNPTRYTVEAGDTLTGIAYIVGMPYWKIQQANPESDPNRLQAGQVLDIPSKNEMLPLPVVPGKRIVISISQQHLWTYENGQQRSDHVISTGIDRSPTIPGIYQVQTHDLEAYASVWDLYMPHFLGIYEGWPGFMNGIHGLPTLSGGRQLWAGNLGHPVSYGCIILDLQAAEDLYTWAENGVVVEITP